LRKRRRQWRSRARLGKAGDTATKILVIGIGNTLRSDDGVGVRAVELFEGALASGCINVSNVEFDTKIVQQLLPELACDLSRCDRAIFVDVSLHLPPGTISLATIEPGDSYKFSKGSHGIDIPFLLSIVKEIYGRAPSVMLLSVGGECFDLSEELSHTVRNSLPAVRDKMMSQLRAWSEENIGS
jgi:hydrogenase maturation protease